MSIFDQTIKRRFTNSVKWDAMKMVYGLNDASEILPMWVADMDFAAPTAVSKALQEHAERTVFGYSFMSEEAIQSIVDWQNTRHDWQIDKDSIVFCNGVVAALANSIVAFTNPGDKVLISTPVYPPFFNIPKSNGREVVSCPLVEKNDGKFIVDFEAFEQALAQNVKAYILCNPHNPGGYVWDEATLKEIVRLCAQYDVLIISDEIHADLMINGEKHIPIAKIAGDEINRIVTCMAPTKTFNLAGIQVSYMIVPDKKKRLQLEAVNMASGQGSLNTFASVALQAAYTEGTPWLDELLPYISANMDYVKAELEQIPGIRIIKPQSTYLIWIDYRELKLEEKDIMKRLLEIGQLALEPGTKYGEEGRGFLRMNVACSFETVRDGVERFKKAFEQ
ncbi:MalY/PatB family protein [Lysinibacillus sp. fkY74-1]|uniref:cysteine-S-conjugate beta-lyase n=2 Tax=Lysinibacillus TaxID=400634 RepID=W7RU45_LYSSH|nr:MULTISPECIES: MalY/PatB family protein [Lysinibacillus]MBE5084496.1 pyridoxal phosphate-dependent aminotransferase [Bacillus thuringiensis]AMO32384.1 Fis family transcriptional regulator [Lysinibacillus sphaericus]AMR92516.1 Fis family transcriptional regulator [Lysinibacillus sphaericus]ANA46565.1 Fis family transcriptional regulator [Lysinibacillus sphaericus]EWH30660.1 Fis family transcriptional regulator [Lysinibacillus sphaericus CBAM5]